MEDSENVQVYYLTILLLRISKMFDNA